MQRALTYPCRRAVDLLRLWQHLAEAGREAAVGVVGTGIAAVDCTHYDIMSFELSWNAYPWTGSVALLLCSA
eukprot:m.427747 g.427747  ORF g.427747 m.427747 type:complete len:72 (-) comp21364_c0_seq2:272-487(-)